MDRSRTLTEQLAAQHAISDCDTFVDGNGELHHSSDTPDRIGAPLATPAPSPQPVEPSDEEVILF